MGAPEIKYGDSVCFVMHVNTGLWLSYLSPDAKSSRLGPLKRRVSLRAPFGLVLAFIRTETFETRHTVPKLFLFLDSCMLEGQVLLLRYSLPPLLIV